MRTGRILLPVSIGVALSAVSVAVPADSAADRASVMRADAVTDGTIDAIKWTPGKI